MKKNLKLWMLLVLVLNIVSCSDDCNEPALVTDPYPYPQEYLANKDLSVKPGDSFFDYCNGAWLAANPIPSDTSKTIGGFYAARDKMNERIEQLKTSVADIGKMYELMDHIHSYPEASRNYIATQRAKIQKPSSKEEAYRTIGRMYLDGVDALRISLDLVLDKTQLKAVLVPDGFSLSEYTLTNSSRVATLLAEGMGIDPSMLMGNDNEAKEWDRMWNEYTVDQLYQMMQDARRKYCRPGRIPDSTRRLYSPARCPGIHRREA